MSIIFGFLGRSSKMFPPKIEVLLHAFSIKWFELWFSSHFEIWFRRGSFHSSREILYHQKKTIKNPKEIIGDCWSRCLQACQFRTGTRPLRPGHSSSTTPCPPSGPVWRSPSGWLPGSAPADSIGATSSRTLVPGTPGELVSDPNVLAWFDGFVSSVCVF